jgi:hypothetical protein
LKTTSNSLSLLSLLAAVLSPAYSAAAASPEPCHVLSAQGWGAVMGYSATATPGDMTCTYQGPTKADGGGQFRILANVGNATEAAAAAKRMRDHQAHQPKGGHDPNLSIVDSEGTVVFSIALFQPAATANTAKQLQALAAAVKQQLPK